MAVRPPEQVLVHFYRGELGRSDTWRTRLDATTNWALTTAAAVISLAFSSREASHVILLVGLFLVWTFLILEARRYRYYDLWIRRVRLLEEGFLLPTLRAEPPDPDALRELADVMAHPHLVVSGWDAIGLRLRRAYAPIMGVLSAAWVVKVISHPHPAERIGDLATHAHIGPVPGEALLVLFVAHVVVVASALLRSVVRPLPLGELQPRRRGRRSLADVFQRASTSAEATSVP